MADTEAEETLVDLAFEYGHDLSPKDEAQAKLWARWQPSALRLWSVEGRSVGLPRCSMDR